MKTLNEVQASVDDRWDDYQALLNAGAPDHELHPAWHALEKAKSDLEAFRLEEGIAEILAETVSE